MAATPGYSMSPGLKVMLADAGLDLAIVLRRAGLPDDLFNQDRVKVSGETFFRLSDAIDRELPDGTLWVNLTNAMRPEWFSPPIFAALCSPNLRIAAERLALFKPLVAPVTLLVDVTPQALRLTYRWDAATIRPAAPLHGTEALFITKLARLGTRADISPIRVAVPEFPRSRQAFEAFLGVPMTQGGDTIQIEFDLADAQRPFSTANPAMWSIFEPALRKRLADLTGGATFEERTRAVLIEALPSGQIAMEAVARRLAVSTRTLQRRLGAEDTSFKEVMRQTRESLARHYLRHTDLTATEIAYLIGFEESSSFFRAFHRWTGSTPETVRKRMTRDPLSAT